MPRRRGRTQAQKREQRKLDEASSSEELSDDLGASRQCADGSFTNSRSRAEKIRKEVEAKERVTLTELQSRADVEFALAEKRERLRKYRIALQAMEEDLARRAAAKRRSRSPRKKKPQGSPRPQASREPSMERSPHPNPPHEEEPAEGSTRTPRTPEEDEETD